MAALLVVAGEASADVHAAGVVRHLNTLRPDLHIAGVGGDGCRAAGMDILVDNRELGLMGFTEVLGGLGRVKRAYARCLKFVDDEKVTAALLLDFADFNLRLARALKARGIKVIYFISPKVWAWRKSRVKIMKERIDRLLVIFPFEVEFFARHGITAEYVGNPTLDELASPPQKDVSRAAFHIEPQARVVALLPGSRRSEVTRHLAPLLGAARQLSREMPGVMFVLPRASTIGAALVDPAVALARAAGVDVRVVDGRAPDVVAAADTAVVASGTATLEAALVGTPLVVIYRTTWLTALIVRFVLRIRFVSPPNILMGRRLVAELLQWGCTPARIASEVRRLWEPQARDAMQKDLGALRTLLGAPGAAQRVAVAVLETMNLPARKEDA